MECGDYKITNLEYSQFEELVTFMESSDFLWSDVKLLKYILFTLNDTIEDNIVVLGGEISSTKSINYDDSVRYVFKELDFPLNHQLSPDNIKIINLIGKQSPEISAKVDKYCKSVTRFRELL